MTDEELVNAFESTELRGEDFTHAAHVRVAWWYLRAYPLPAALERFTASLIRFATAKGAPEKYDRALTEAWMERIASRVAGREQLSWAAFAERNPDLLSARAPGSDPASRASP